MVEADEQFVGQSAEFEKMIMPEDSAQLFPQLLRKARACTKQRGANSASLKAEKDRSQALQVLARQARSNAKHTESILRNLWQGKRLAQPRERLEIHTKEKNA